MNSDRTLTLTEEIDFAYLLNLMPPLHDEGEFNWLPELFSIIGHEKLILLCKYAGGETIKIPTVSELSYSIQALQEFYNIHVKKCKKISECPADLRELVQRIYDVYTAREY